ncbi:CBM96 family carbohydrate-binding protein [Paramicrobacterium chengjingii]|uniref:DNRLRE domain-containing protein n=1 Tax=Paramicrobacterium chengjingii TaxID=2769067 RepID=A0ABX6YGW8_9MICO|nr:LamG-like jellyroll fold domain-containing protein [Microbacterium chengjingii]QPZ37637.1 DNRLRE domain-containing protein [Microbacterium chengjingii]
MRIRRIGSVVAACGLMAGLIVFAPTLVRALSPGVEFSADDLPTWQTNSVVYALGNSHGKVIAGGSFSQIRPPDGTSGQPRNQAALAIFDADTGEPDSCQFTVEMSGGSPSIRAIVTSDDGDVVYIGGSFSSINDVSIYRAAALDVQSCTVLPFKTSSISASVYGLALSDDTLYLAGAFNSVAGQPRSKFAAVDATTGQLRPWVADADVTGRALAVSPDGTKVAVGGDFMTINGQDSHAIAIVDADTGANVRNYPLGFISRTSVTKTLSTGGDLLFAGNEGTGGGVFDGRFAIDWNTLDQKWRDVCLGATQDVLEYKGTLYSVNHAHDCSGNAGFADGKRSYFVAQDAESATLLGWDPHGNDGIGEGIGGRALTIATGSATGNAYLWAGGEFTRINGQPQQSLTRFGPDDVGAPPTPSVSAATTSDGNIQVRFRTVVDPDDSILTYRVYRDGSSTPLWEGTASSLWWKRPQVTFVDDSVASGSRHTYRVSASDGTNTSSLSTARSATAGDISQDYPSAVRGDNPQFAWSYDSVGGGWVQDGSARSTKTDGLSGIAERGVSVVNDGAYPEDTTGSASFDGHDDYVWEDNYVEAPSTYSIETWIKTTTNSGGKIVGFGNGRPRTNTGDTALSGNYDRHIYMTNSGQLVFGVWVGSAATIRTPEQYNDGQWHHIVATQGDDGMAFYVDGARIGTNPESSAQDYYGVWHVGGDQLNGWPGQPSSNFFSGLIDETAVYQSALSPTSVINHYTAAGGEGTMNPVPSDAYGASVYGMDPALYWRLSETSGSTAADSSIFGAAPGEYGAGVSLGEAGVLGGNSAVAFTGGSSSRVVTSSATSGVGDYSTELWFSTTTQSGGKLIAFESSQTGFSWSTDKNVYMDDDGTIVFSVSTGNVTTSQSYNDGNWHHLVTTQGPDGMALYLDGVLVSANSDRSHSSFDGYWRVGNGTFDFFDSDAPSSSNFSGTIDEVAVYSAPLSAADVAQHYVLGTADTEAPRVPENVVGEVTETGVELSWSAPSDNVGVEAYRVYRSTDSDAPFNQWIQIGEVDETAFADVNVPFGTLYYVVTAVDAAGNVSDASESTSVNVVDVVPPTVPADLTAEGSATGVALAWADATDNVSVDHYTVYRGASENFVADAETAIADIDETDYVDKNLAMGTYYYKVVAVDVAGNASSATSAVAGVVAPDPVTETVSADADAMVYGVQPTSNYGDNVQVSSRGGSSPIETFLTFTLPTSPDGFIVSGVTLMVRTSTDPAAGSADTHDVTIVSDAWDEGTVTWINRPTTVTSALGTIGGMTSTNTTYSADLSAAVLVGMSGQTVTLRISSSGDDNVRLWSSEATHDSYRPKLVLSYAPGEVPEPEEDESAPSSPSGLTATTDGASISLGWDASTDNVSVTGYTVYRSPSTPVQIGEGTKIADVTSTGYSDASLAPGTYYYAVTAMDAAGNTSEPSEEASTTIEQEPVVVTTSPTQDAMVISSVPESNYGGNTQVASRAGSSPQEAFLGFNVPTAPAGMELSGVTLTVRTSTDPVAASVDTHTCSLITSPWSQDTVTWNNRPTDAGIDVAELTGFNAVNTSYTFSLTTSAFVTQLGQSVTLRIVGTGDDNVRLWSSDGPSAYKPVLSFTFAPAE